MLRGRIIDEATRLGPPALADQARALADASGNIVQQLVGLGYSARDMLDVAVAVTKLPPAQAGWLRNPRPPAVDGVDPALCHRLGCAPVASIAGRLCIAFVDPEVAVVADTLGLPPHQPYLALQSDLQRAFDLMQTATPGGSEMAEPAPMPDVEEHATRQDPRIGFGSSSGGGRAAGSPGSGGGADPEAVDDEAVQLTRAVDMRSLADASEQVARLPDPGLPVAGADAPDAGTALGSAAGQPTDVAAVERAAGPSDPLAHEADPDATAQLTTAGGRSADVSADPAHVSADVSADPAELSDLSDDELLATRVVPMRAGGASDRSLPDGPLDVESQYVSELTDVHPIPGFHHPDANDDANEDAPNLDGRLVDADDDGDPPSADADLHDVTARPGEGIPGYGVGDRLTPSDERPTVVAVAADLIAAAEFSLRTQHHAPRSRPAPTDNSDDDYGVARVAPVTAAGAHLPVEAPADFAMPPPTMLTPAPAETEAQDLDDPTAQNPVPPIHTDEPGGLVAPPAQVAAVLDDPAEVTADAKTVLRASAHGLGAQSPGRPAELVPSLGDLASGDGFAPLSEAPFDLDAAAPPGGGDNGEGFDDPTAAVPALMAGRRRAEVQAPPPQEPREVSGVDWYDGTSPGLRRALSEATNEPFLVHSSAPDGGAALRDVPAPAAQGQEQQSRPSPAQARGDAPQLGGAAADVTQPLAAIDASARAPLPSALPKPPRVASSGHGLTVAAVQANDEARHRNGPVSDAGDALATEVLRRPAADDAQLIDAAERRKSELAHLNLVRRYRLDRVLGRGAAATVFYAVDTHTDAPCALKVLDAHVAENPDFVARFRREVQMYSSLDHDGIVKLYDSGEEAGTCYMAVEYLDGGSAETLLQAMGRAVPVVAAVPILAAMLDALQHAHDRGILHRDLNPSNVMLSTQGAVKLADFGVAKRSGDAPLTGMGSLIGTAQYMSPEQTEGKELDARSDLFSLGVVAYELLTGRNPFAHTDVAATLYAIARGMAPPIYAVNPTLPTALERFVTRLLEPERHRRYASAKDAREDLKPLLDAVLASAPHALVHLIASPFVVAEQLHSAHARLEMERGTRALEKTPPDHAEAAFRFYRAVALDPRYRDAKSALDAVVEAYGYRFEHPADAELDALEAKLAENPNQPALLKKVADIATGHRALLEMAAAMRKIVRLAPQDTLTTAKLERIVGADPAAPFSSARGAGQDAVLAALANDADESDSRLSVRPANDAAGESTSGVERRDRRKRRIKERLSEGALTQLPVATVPPQASVLPNVADKAVWYKPPPRPEGEPETKRGDSDGNPMRRSTDVGGGARGADPSQAPAKRTTGVPAAAAARAAESLPPSKRTGDINAANLRAADKADKSRRTGEVNTAVLRDGKRRKGDKNEKGPPPGEFTATLQAYRSSKKKSSVALPIAAAGLVLTFAVLSVINSARNARCGSESAAVEAARVLAQTGKAGKPSSPPVLKDPGGNTAAERQLRWINAGTVERDPFTAQAIWSKAISIAPLAPPANTAYIERARLFEALGRLDAAVNDLVQVKRQTTDPQLVGCANQILDVIAERREQENAPK